MRFRLYVDEVGNSDLRASEDPNHRFLSLTGVIIQQDYANDVLAPRLEAMKRRYFGSHVDEPVILHRKDLVNKKSPFDSLKDPASEAEFNSGLVELLTSLDYRVVTVVIDKLVLQQKFTTWRHDPYHYCLEIMIERYVLWLDQRQSIGDMLAEARGKREGNSRVGDETGFHKKRKRPQAANKRRTGPRRPKPSPSNGKTAVSTLD